MRSLRLLSCLLVLVMASVLLAGCSIKNEELIITAVPEVLKEQMTLDRDAGGAFVYRPEDHDIDAYYLMFSPGIGDDPDAMAPVPFISVMLRGYKYDRQTKTLTVTVHQYTQQIAQPGGIILRNVPSGQSWNLILKFTGPMENFRVITSEGVEIPVLVR